MFHDDSSAISSSGIDRLILDIYDYADKGNKIINDISTLISSTSGYYKSSDGEQFRKSYESLNFGTQKLNENILSIISDLTKIKSEYQKRNVKAAEIIEEANITEKRKNSKG